jgi:hypothetical protein
MKEFELEKIKSQQVLAKLDEKSKQFQKLQVSQPCTGETLLF